MPSLFDKRTAAVQVQRYTANRAASVAAPANKHPALHDDAPSTMHDDAASTDASPFAGPIGQSASRTWLERDRSAAGLCPAFVFYGDYTFTVSFSFRENVLVALDKNLDVVDTLVVPRRSIDWSRLFSDGLSLEAVTRRLFRDTSGGAYFFVEDDGRIVLPTAANTMWRVQLQNGRFVKEQPFDFHPADGGPYEGTKLPSPHYRHRACSELNVCYDFEAQHRVIAALPTWESHDAYWFVTNLGVIGVVDAPPNATACYLDLNDRKDNRWARSDEDERIQNSFSVGKHGAFVVSDHALYRLVYEGGHIRIAWRQAVPRTPSNQPKPGHVGVGSGTTPTLVRDKYVAITDAASKLSIMLCTQEAGPDGRPKQTSTVTAFGGSTKSACENSLVSFGNYLVIGNTWGYVTPFERKKRPSSVPGLECYEIYGGGKLRKAWSTGLNVMSAPPKLGCKNATLYAYTLDAQNDWALVGVDPFTGDEVYRGVMFKDGDRDNDNAWGTMSIGPRDELFLAQWSGLVRVKDV